MCAACKFCGQDRPETPSPCPVAGHHHFIVRDTEHYDVVNRVKEAAQGLGLGENSQVFDSLAPDGSTTRADATGKALAHEVHGKAPQGEAGNLEVARILIQRLNCDGAQWGDRKDVGADKQRHEDGVDCEASDGAKRLRMQFTRVAPNEQFWPSLGRHGVAVGSATAQEAANRLRAALEGKLLIPPKQRTELVLVINALLSAGSAFDVVTAALLG